MKIQINKNLDEFEKKRKKKRNQLICLILVFLCGVYYIAFGEHLTLEIMGWFMIASSVMVIFFCHVLLPLDNLLFPFKKILYKYRKSYLHFKYETETFKNHDD